MMQYGLIGEHLGYSFSKDIHEQLSPCAYELCELPREALGAFLRETPFLGINVTIPYKEAVLPWLSWISPEARAIGAVNTIVRRDGRLLGYNTDYFGLKALAAKAGVSFRGRRVLILGAGGAAKTAHALAVDEGAVSVTHAVRRPRESGQVPLTGVRAEDGYEILVNCTPVGTFPGTEDRPIGPETLPALKGVLDLIYNPLRSNLILDAQEAGIAAEGGLYMLVAQAVKARALFDEAPGQDRDAEITEHVFQRLYKAKRNLVLTGMPSSGKSTLGRLLAGKTGRRFVDTDDLIQAKAGKTIPRLFAEDGETRFRQWESEVIREVSLETGLVIATGGGAVLDWQNVRRLRRNGTILYLRRDLEKLTASADRPLSADHRALEQLYLRRRAAYEKAAEHCIDNNGSLADSLGQLEDLL